MLNAWRDNCRCRVTALLPSPRQRNAGKALQPVDVDEPSRQASTRLTPGGHYSADASLAPTGPSFAPLMTVADAAAALRVSTNMIARGELPYVGVGRLPRIRAEDMMQYIAERTSV